MVLELSLNDLYTALFDDPDLRRLGPYKVVATERQTIFPIDIDFGDQDVHLGEGDFTDGFVAFCNSRARSLDLGSSVFTDFYPDFIEVDVLLCSESRASRFYFDDAKIGLCNFGKLVSPEVYFDRAQIDVLLPEELQSGVIYIEALESEGFNPERLISNAHRVTLDKGRIEDAAANKQAIVEGSDDTVVEVRILKAGEFIDYLLAGNLDLRGLGKYKVVPDGDSPLEINLDLEGRGLNFGAGDFTSVSISFCATRSEYVDFSESVFGHVDFRDSQIGSCFFADFQGKEVHFGNARMENVFWERGSAAFIYLDKLTAGQFNINDMETEEIRLGDSQVREMYLSTGEGVQRMFCEHAQIGLLNLHEGRLIEVDFGESRIHKALINKATIDLVKAEGLVADKLYIGNDGKNEIGELRLGLHEGVKEVDLEKALFKEGREVERTIIKGFGPL